VRNEYVVVEKRVSLLHGQLEETKAQLEATEKAYKSAHTELNEAVERISELSTANSTLQAAKRKVDTELQTAHVCITQERIQELWKGGAVRGQSTEPSAENFEKLDAISCNLAYIFGIRMASDIIQNWAFAEQKPVAATISIHTHTRIHPPTYCQKLLGFRPL